MNRQELYRLIPDPDEMGQSEYRTLHNLIVDAIGEWVTSEDEDVTDFTEAVMLEVIGWADFILNKIGRERQ